MFSYLGRESDHPAQLPCHITATTERTHEIIRAATDRSPMFTGKIEGVGPRYCPSVEDKVVRFADKTSHQIFIEPEGLNTHEVYPNGISTSLPYDVQFEFVRTIKGFENAHITRPGYAIEYDFFDPRDLKPSLETKALARPLLRGPDQRHHGLRRSRGAGTHRRHQRRARARPQEAFVPEAQRELRRRAHRRPRHAAARASPIACSPAAPSIACCCAKTTPICASRPPGASMGLVDDARWAFFEAKRAGSARELARFSDTRIKAAEIPGRMGARACSAKPRRAMRCQRIRPAAPARSVATNT